MSDTIKVSIIVLAYNHEKYIGRSLDSVFEQQADFKTEVLVCDDFSQDRTAEIISEYAKIYKNLIFVEHNTNKGGTSSLSELLTMAQGQYIACLEGDDYWCNSKKLITQVSFLDNHDEYFFCGSRCYCIDENGNEVKSELRWVSGRQKFALEDFNGITLPCHPNTYVFRNKIEPHQKQLPFFDRNIGDRTLTSILLFGGRCFVFDEKMLCYRKICSCSGSNITSKYYHNNDWHFKTDYIIARRMIDYFRAAFGVKTSFKGVIVRILLRSFLKLCTRPTRARAECFGFIIKEVVKNGFK